VKQLDVQVLASPDSTEALASGRAELVEQAGETRLVIPLDQPLPVEPGPRYVVRLSLGSPGAVMLRGTMDVVTESAEGTHVESMGFPNQTYAVPMGIPQDFSFTARQSGMAEGLRLPFARRISDGAQVEELVGVAEVYDESAEAAQSSLAAESHKRSRRASRPRWLSHSTPPSSWSTMGDTGCA